MRGTVEDIKLWRAGEIAKLHLLKSNFQINFKEQSRSPFDLIASIVDEIEVNFGIIILLLPPSEKELEKRVNAYADSLLQYYEIPVLLLLIDEAQESGKLDFAVAPDGQDLLVTSSYDFQSLNTKNLDGYLEKILVWGKKKDRKTA